MKKFLQRKIGHRATGNAIHRRKHTRRCGMEKERVTLKESNGAVEMVFTDGDGGKRVVTAPEPLAAWARGMGFDVGKIEVDPAVRELMVADGEFAETVLAACDQSLSKWSNDKDRADLESFGDLTTFNMTRCFPPRNYNWRPFLVITCRIGASVSLLSEDVAEVYRKRAEEIYAN